MEFRGKVLFHQIVRDFLFNYLVTAYLRKLLLTGKLELSLPYRSTEGEARLWQDAGGGADEQHADGAPHGLSSSSCRWPAAAA